ncbi:hypothetical protein PV403_14175 [Paenibacillus sp. GYB006]|uniref:exo-rhamnogalacturonan lyase family protein n=1 Tax=Paenibacillus sp. GYB006 TaxID=2994394 RepID=UPI002F960CF4
MNSQKSVSLRWLKEPAKMPVGVTWGIPWREGELTREEPISLRDSKGIEVPVQSWATAYWPDRSVKWTAHAAVVGTGSETEGSSNYTIAKGETTESAHKITVEETDTSFVIDTGVIKCAVARQGSALIQSITRSGIELCSHGELVCIKELISPEDAGVRVVREEKFHSVISKTVVEQDGPIRAVVKLDGKHRSTSGDLEWLPFTIRLYFYAGQETIRIVHTLLYDGDPNEDYIKGVGIAFSVPMRGPLYNRHVRFAGDSGYFSESPKTLHTRRTQGKYRERFEKQTKGENVYFQPDEDAYFIGLLHDSATWDDFKLVQDSAEHYRISKRTKEECCWLKAVDGRHSGGLGFIGSEGGGIAAGLRNFWQKCPSGLELTHTSRDQASFTIWFWSPDAPAMDLRHYDTETHVESSYEGAEELRATPYGIGNTSELMLWCVSETPGTEMLEKMTAELESPSLLVCEPAYLHEVRAFGIWSLPDRSSPSKAYLEDQLDGVAAFYQREVQQRGWYGFWDYGDFMHSYDPVRHVWNYDLGGCAWQNTELVPNMWLWVLFLRSGREDLFRLAEAMTRHTSEVDVYHFGEYAGLGSRHNVVHWGCGCKEARIGMAGLHRYYYYLTADERIGDIMDEVKDSDYTTVHLDPMRAYFPKDEHPTHIRVGPDWAAFSSNWMTRWERYEDTAYRDKIITGIDSIKAARYGLISGPTYGYDPNTGRLTPMGDDNWGRHLMICMGAPQVWFELADLLKDPIWEQMMAEFGVYYNLSQEQKDTITFGEVSTNRFAHPVLSIAMAAFGAYYKQDRSTAEQAWSILLDNSYARVQLQDEAVQAVHVGPLEEIDWINTNEAAQWSLNTIISLALIAEHLPEIPRIEKEDHPVLKE